MSLLSLFNRPQGTAITAQHRGVRSYAWTRQHTAGVLVPLLLHVLLVAALLLPVQMLWHSVLEFAWSLMGLGSGAATDVRATHEQLWGLSWPTVAVQIETPLPTLWQWWLAAISVLVFLALSFIISRERLPLVYLLRMLGILGLISLVLYEFLTGVSNLQLSYVLNDMLKIGITMLAFTPLLHALVLYIFPLSIGQKLLATLVSQAFTIIGIPLQVAALAWLVTHTSSLMLLPAYMLATFLPHVIAQLGIYGYFMSWTKKPH